MDHRTLRLTDGHSVVPGTKVVRFYSGSILVGGCSVEIIETLVGLGLRYIYGSLFISDRPVS